jgi:nitrous oxide reductase accessory protein NosL
MKRIVLATVLVTASAFGAMAQEGAMMLPSAIQSQIMTKVPGVDLSDLTSSQYARLVALFSNPDDLRPGNDLTGSVKAILNAQ